MSFIAGEECIYIFMSNFCNAFSCKPRNPVKAGSAQKGSAVLTMDRLFLSKLFFYIRGFVIIPKFFKEVFNQDATF